MPLTEEERKARHREAVRRYKQRNKEKHAAHSLKYYNKNKDAINARRREQYKQKKAESQEMPPLEDDTPLRE